MRMVLPMSRIREMEPYMDAKVLDYIHEGQIEAFEGFEDFDLIAFDWYDVRSERTAASQMLLYLDREDLFVFCEDDAAEDAAQAALLVPEEEALSNEQVARLHPGNHHATSVRKQCSLRCIKVHAIVKCVRLFLDK